MSNPYYELIFAFCVLCNTCNHCGECEITEVCDKIGGGSGPCDWTEQTIKDFLGVKENETSAE